MSKKYFDRIFPIFLMLMLSILCLQMVVDNDLGWHIRLGNYALENGYFLNKDTFTYSVYGQTFYSPSVVTDVALAWIYGRSGWVGLVVFYTLIYAVSGLILGKLVKIVVAKGQFGWWASLATLGLMVIVGTRVLAVSVVCLLGLWYLLERWWQEIGANQTNWKVELVMVGLMGVWPWLHSGYLLGGVLLVCWLVAKGVEDRKVFIKRLAVRRIARLVALVGLVLMLNPYGLRIALFGLNLVTSAPVGEFNQDWQSLLSSALPSNTIGVRLGIVGVAVAILFTPKVRLSLKILVAVMFGLSLWKIRFLPVLYMVLVPAVFEWIAEAVKRKKELMVGKEWLLIMVSVMAMVRLVMVGGDRCIWNTSECFESQWNAPSVELLAGLPAGGEVFNWYDWGGVIGWVRPDVKVFIDGRLDSFSVNGKSVFALADQVYQGKIDGDGERWLEESEVILMPVGWNALNEIEQLGWVVVASDSSAVMLEKQ